MQLPLFTFRSSIKCVEITTCVRNQRLGIVVYITFFSWLLRRWVTTIGTVEATTNATTVAAEAIKSTQLWLFSVARVQYLWMTRIQEWNCKFSACITIGTVVEAFTVGDFKRLSLTTTGRLMLRLLLLPPKCFTKWYRRDRRIAQVRIWLDENSITSNFNCCHHNKWRWLLECRLLMMNTWRRLPSNNKLKSHSTSINLTLCFQLHFIFITGWLGCFLLLLCWCFICLAGYQIKSLYNFFFRWFFNFTLIFVFFFKHDGLFTQIFWIIYWIHTYNFFLLFLSKLLSIVCLNKFLNSRGTARQLKMQLHHIASQVNYFVYYYMYDAMMEFCTAHISHWICVINSLFFL